VVKYFVTINDQTYEIEIDIEGEISVDGEHLVVDLQSLSGQSVYSLILDGKSYEAFLNQTKSGTEVMLRGQRYMVDIEDEGTRRLREVSGALKIQSGEIQLKAPMPGLIISIPVEEGQEVSKGENLIVLESMKMQNELKSPRKAKVTGVRVKPGDNVDQNDILIILS
jgi:biotin carboxyl carrier protein